MLCPLKFGYYEFEGGQDCIGAECGMHNLCNAETEITAVEFDALDEHAQALERENAELRKHVDNLTKELTAARNAHAQAEHDAETYREKLGRMLDNAHEITRIGGDC